MATFSPYYLYSRCSRNTIIMLINAAILMKFFVMQSSLLCISGGGGSPVSYRGRRSTVAHSEAKTAIKLRIRKGEETIHLPCRASMNIKRSEALASCYDLLVGRVNVENWVHPRIFISPVLSAIVAPTPLKLRSLFSSLFFLFFFCSFCTIYIDVSLRQS